MSKRVLSAFLVVPALFLGLNFFISPPVLVKTADAATISDFNVQAGPDNFAGEPGDYSMHFDLGAAPLLVGTKINITFPTGFSFDGETDVSMASPQQFRCATPVSTRKATCTVSTSVAGIVYIDAIGVINTSSPSTSYTLTADTTAGGFATSNPFSVGTAPSGGGEDEGGTKFPPAFGKCPHWYSFGCWLKNAMLYLPKVVIALIFVIVEEIIKFLIVALVLVGEKVLDFSKDLNNSFNIDGPLSGALLPAAYTGYQITLGFTNIGFVLAIIIIAFATILRMESYAIKKALPRLIVTAIIINFSLFFAVSIIQFSNTIGNGLHDVVLSGINNKTEFGSFFESNDAGPSFVIANLSGLGGFEVIINNLINGIVGVVILLIFGIIYFFALIATAIMMLIRYMALNFLIIGLPIALLVNIFPNLSVPGGGNLWKDWTKSFTKWVIFYPAMMFFLAIGTLMMSTIATPPGAPSTIGGFGNLLMVVGVLIGGLMVSQKLGLAGAAGANMASGWATKKAGGIAGHGLRGAGAGLGLATTGQSYRDLAGKFRRGGAGGDESPRQPLQLANDPLLGTASEQAGARQAGDNSVGAKQNIARESADAFNSGQVDTAAAGTPTPNLESQLTQPTQEDAATMGARKKYEERKNVFKNPWNKYIGKPVGGLKKVGAGVMEARRDFKAASKWGKVAMIGKGVGKMALAPIKLAGAGLEGVGGALAEKSRKAGSLGYIVNKIIEKEINPKKSVFGELFTDKKEKTNKDKLIEAIKEEGLAEEKAKGGWKKAELKTKEDK